MYSFLEGPNWKFQFSQVLEAGLLTIATLNVHMLGLSDFNLYV